MPIDEAGGEGVARAENVLDFHRKGLCAEDLAVRSPHHGALAAALQRQRMGPGPEDQLDGAGEVAFYGGFGDPRAFNRHL